MRSFLTTPIYYVTAKPHLGHAYTTIVGDALARWHRLRGDDVHFLTGTDEHGLKVQQHAAAAGLSPQAFVDGIAPLYREAWHRLHVSADDFIRTTEPRHKAGVVELLQRCYDAGDIDLGVYAGKYCVACEEYYTDDELDPGDLCRIHRRPVDYYEEENYFFRLSRFQGRLLELVRGPSRRHRPRVPPQRGPRAGQDRAARLQHQSHESDLGHPTALGREARDLRVVRRVGQLPVGDRFRERRRPLPQVVAGPAPARQGHPAAPLRLLAGDADERRSAAAGGMGGGRPPPERRAEDEQDDGQRRQPARARRRHRRGRVPLLPAGGYPLWAGRRLHLRGPDRPLQQRPGQQPRQPAVAGDDGGGEEVRRHRPGAEPRRRAQRHRRGGRDPHRGRLGRGRPERGPRGHLVADRRRQRLSRAAISRGRCRRARP